MRTFDDYERLARTAREQLARQEYQRREAEQRRGMAINEMRSYRIQSATSFNSEYFAMPTSNPMSMVQKEVKIQFGEYTASFMTRFPEGTDVRYVIREIEQHTHELFRRFPDGWRRGGEQDVGQSSSGDSSESTSAVDERLSPTFE